MISEFQGHLASNAWAMMLGTVRELCFQLRGYVAIFKMESFSLVVRVILMMLLYFNLCNIQVGC
uniref:Uncharacterized protein n=1 Tax=Manihot esculenta TaxID=3983 RepID=A0A2C9U3R0_MANES